MAKPELVAGNLDAAEQIHALAAVPAGICALHCAVYFRIFAIDFALDGACDARRLLYARNEGVTEPTRHLMVSPQW